MHVAAGGEGALVPCAFRAYPFFGIFRWPARSASGACHPLHLGMPV